MELNLTASQQRELLRLARQTIAKGCTHSAPPEIELESQPELFQQHLASFVTLQKLGELRGCVGSLKAYRPLVEDVVHNAFASAFRDHRFQPVAEKELTDIKVEISILSPMELMPVKTEEELVSTMVPQKDGILIQSSQYSATFLPQVWEQLPDPHLFLTHLKRKAGLGDNQWPEDMQCFRYCCYKFKE